MKRLFITIIFLLTFGLLSAEEFSLFPWVCNQKDVYSYCMNRGWKYSSDVSDDVTSFYFTPSEDVTYHGRKIYILRFSFYKNDKLMLQAITFSDMDRLDIAFSKLLDNMVTDKARLLNKTMDKNDELYNIQFKAELSNNIQCNYFLVGKENAYQNSVAYMNY